MTLPENEDDMEKSRVRYAIGEAAGGAIDQLTGGVFIASLMIHEGFRDADIGIITSLASLLAVAQIFIAGFAARLKKSKFFVCMSVMQRFWLIFMFLVPFYPFSSNVKMTLLVLLYIISKIGIQIGTPSLQEWIASLVPPFMRGRYFARKDILNVIVMSVVILIAGWVMDLLKGRNILYAFQFIAVLLTVLCLVSFIFYSMVKEPKLAFLDDSGHELHGHRAKAYAKKVAASEPKESFLAEIGKAFGNKNFRIYLGLECLWILTFYMAAPFNASYSIKELGLSFFYISLIGFGSNLFRIFLAGKMGGWADRYGMSRIFKYAILLYALNSFIWVFTIPNNAYLMYTAGVIAAGAAWSFLGPGLFSIKVEFIERGKRVSHFAIIASITGVVGFLISIVGGVLLQFLQKAQFSFFGSPLYAQQILNLLSTIFALLTALYIHGIVQKAQIQDNEEDGALK